LPPSAARFAENDDFALRHNAEFVAFSRVSAQLDKSLAAMFDPKYLELLAAAQGRVAAGYEGKAPGVRDGAA
jgi:hypothetical protein